MSSQPSLRHFGASCFSLFLFSLNAIAASDATQRLSNYSKADALSQLKPHRAIITDDGSDHTLTINFEPDGYPKLAFPCPIGGWDLSPYQGIELQATNLSEHPVRGALRIDNPGEDKEQFWNTESQLIQPGETVTLRSVFGQNNGRPGFPLDASEITAYQFFLVNPSAPTVMKLGEPAAYGAASEEQRRERFSKPADRQTSVTQPDWLGAQPPISGDWVIALNEEFDQDQLNAGIWSTRLAFGGPAKIETQRYRDENVRLENNAAVLTVAVNPGHQYDDPTLPQRNYAAGMLSSYDRWTQRYGYFEMRAKMPTARGLAPTLTLIPDRGADGGLNLHERRTSHDFNGKGMEMDIVRHLTEWGPGRVGIGVRWGGPAGTHIQRNWGDSYIYHGPTEDGWHTYGLLWEPDRLVWHIDGQKKGEWQSDAIADVPCYLAVTLPMGKHATKNVDQARLPDDWRIDYLRVWQLQTRLTAVD
ncbi:glycoside hydrolase family 16 protein [Cerasicoccus frondis]|uniref:glycoside hydrolase family 16 protein n=1 Tax=Cerasicoccus frondis TaxID=490090 RepID=UPI002852522D|nr:glycoside hydrolase family 16 protein [Cerasicoccus frondis]